MLKVSKDQVETIRSIGNKATKMIRQIIGDASLNNLPNIAYARHEYWAGKALAIDEVIRILKVKKKGGEVE